MSSLRKISHSEIAAWRDCQQKHDYRYNQRIVPVRRERPLYLGSWVHACLEAHYGQGNWRIGHAKYVKEYSKLLDEEQRHLDRGPSRRKNDDDLEPLPSQVERIMRSYLWYYRRDTARTVGVEVRFELDMGDYILVGVIDQVYVDDDGLYWIRDHKVWTEIPDEQAFHTMDPQLTIYLHGARAALGIEAAGIEYNYLRSQAPTLPKLNKDGSISKNEIVTDYPTVYRFLRDNGCSPADYRGLLAPLAASSPLLRRYRLPRSEVVTERILRDVSRSAHDIMASTEPVRNITRSCSYCSYAQLCRGELYGIDTAWMRSLNFEVEKPRRKRGAPVGNPSQV